MATHSSVLAWRIPGAGEPDGLLSMGSHRVGHDWVTSLLWLHFHFSLSCIGEGNGNPLECSCLENPRGGGTWWAAVYGVAQNWTQLKQLSSSSSHPTISSSVISFSWLQSFPAAGSFQMSQLFTSGGQSIGVSASTSVLAMNTQDWSLGWTGWIFLQSKGLSRVFSNTTVQKLQFFSAQLFL